VCAYATVTLRPETPFEIPEQKQKKIVQNLPSSGGRSVVTDRIQTYFIEARLTTSSAVSIEEGLEIFYFEIYWD
jgi:hypothetical protein